MCLGRNWWHNSVSVYTSAPADLPDPLFDFSEGLVPRLPACRACGALSNDMQSVEIRYCSEDLHSCSVSSSALVHEIAMAVEASIFWSEPLSYMGGSMPHSRWFLHTTVLMEIRISNGSSRRLTSLWSTSPQLIKLNWYHPVTRGGRSFSRLFWSMPAGRLDVELSRVEGYPFSQSVPTSL